MTRTGPADVVMPAFRRTAPGRPVLTRPRSRELVSARPANGRPAVARAVFPAEESVKPVPGWRPARPRQPRPAELRSRHRRGGSPRPTGPGLPAHPLYLYLLKRPAVALSGCPFDPGRDMLCILTSPPRWLQWP
jgi:hypothetical protein